MLWGHVWPLLLALVSRIEVTLAPGDEVGKSARQMMNGRGAPSWMPAALTHRTSICSPARQCQLRQLLWITIGSLVGRPLCVRIPHHPPLSCRHASAHRSCSLGWVDVSRHSHPCSLLPVICFQEVMIPRLTGRWRTQPSRGTTLRAEV